jgi:prevent-host-death family protein
MSWQLQDAKQRFSELVQRALDEGPQVVTRRGEPVVVIVSTDEFDRLREPRPDFKDFLMASPDFTALDIYRDQSPARRVEL